MKMKKHDYKNYSALHRAFNDSPVEKRWRRKRMIEDIILYAAFLGCWGAVLGAFWLMI